MFLRLFGWVHKQLRSTLRSAPSWCSWSSLSLNTPTSSLFSFTTPCLSDVPFVHVIHLTSELPPTVSYEGHIPNFPATAVGVEGTAPFSRLTKSNKILSRVSRLRQRIQNRLNSSAPHVRAYAAYLRQKHMEVATSAGVDTRKVLYR